MALRFPAKDLTIPAANSRRKSWASRFESVRAAGTAGGSLHALHRSLRFPCSHPVHFPQRSLMRPCSHMPLPQSLQRMPRRPCWQKWVLHCRHRSPLSLCSQSPKLHSLQRPRLCSAHLLRPCMSIALYYRRKKLLEPNKNIAVCKDDDES